MKPRSILVIEDYPDLRDTIIEVLSQNDCVCESAGSAEAIAKLAAKRYGTILLAPRLAIQGDPVLHYLMENQPGELEHVVVMQNPVRDDDESPDERCHVLMKPFSRAELLAAVS
jgi:CheY-like chemotaxis protein